MKQRSPTAEPWMAAPDFGRSLRPGLGVNLLVRDMAKAVRFAEEVLWATVIYWDADFAAVRAYGSEWMLHADHTYDGNPLSGIVKGSEARGVGVELRLFGLDPDQAEARARQGGWTVLSGAIDKPHGLRECMIIDDDGYVWIPGVGIVEE
jgi:hypothetical protein